MPRRLTPEREREYEELNAFLDFYATNYMGIDPADPVHPTNAGRDIVAKVGKSKALEGLRQAVNDIVEALSTCPREEISRMDGALRAAGLLTIAEVRLRHSRKLQRIVSRGHIRTDTEYYLIKGIADGFPDPPVEVTALFDMLADYERRRVGETGMRKEK